METLREQREIERRAWRNLKTVERLLENSLPAWKGRISAKRNALKWAWWNTAEFKRLYQ